ncbi:fluoride efflux transporter CrcB [Acinetobacter bouvetii]|uniref:Fluoride-specific ion channel FluC n=1 Tax=Acinetobacter bouvetii TaxID=202951 RepID=A0A811GIA6_9GAMM|nr:fluoride efflux transporter CrcB [Acinetobacter bouvetii]CAB1223192.1 Putative fluoride ion transporter CrcB [Acinetobacter bouvetii]
MNWLLVALGGAIGASLRYGAGIVLLKPSSVFPWTTWWINLCGCLLAGIFFAYSQKFPVLQNEARLFLMVGILGGFTTFSSFGLETFQLLKHGQTALALTYVISSVIMGVVVLAVGFYLFQWLLHSK